MAQIYEHFIQNSKSANVGTCDTCAANAERLSLHVNSNFKLVVLK